MKKIFLILTVIAYSYAANSQPCSQTTCNVCTPNGSSVNACAENDDNFPLHQRQAYDAYYGALPGVINLIMPTNGYPTSSTAQYNCHGYAWHMKPNAAPSDYRWMSYGSGSINLEKYWLDGSYLEVTKEIHPGIVYYSSNDHSAVTTGISGVYESKWNQYSLLRHQWNIFMNYQINQSSLRYFVDVRNIGSGRPISYASIGINGPNSIKDATTYSLDITPGQGVSWSLSSNTYFSVSANDTQATVTPNAQGIINQQSVSLYATVKGVLFTKTIQALPATISGSYHLCTGSNYTFTASAPSGISWNCSLNLSVTPGANNTATVKGNSAGAGWVSILLNGTELKKVDVWVGPPVITGISGPQNPQTYTPYSFTTQLQNTLAKPTSYYFNVSGGSYYMETGGTNWEHVAYITFYEKETYSITAIAYYPCGQSNVYYTYVTVGNRGGASIAYPNPVSDILFVDLDAYAEQQGQLINAGQRANITYDVRLYDMNGILQLQQKAKSGIVQFDVSNLPDGNYFLHIYDGLSNVPSIMQIIVRRQ